MYAWFSKQPLVGRVIIVMVLLLVAMAIINIVLGIVKMLIPFAIVALVIVGALTLLDRVK